MSHELPDKIVPKLIEIILDATNLYPLSPDQVLEKKWRKKKNPRPWEKDTRSRLGNLADPSSLASNPQVL